MKAMVLEEITDLQENNEPLTLKEMPEPVPAEKEILLKVKSCGVCHTELDEIEGRTPPPQLPIILGHQVVGEVVDQSRSARKFQNGDRIGIGWIFSSCGQCHYCQHGLENLCPDFRATGRDAHGGYAEYMTVPEDYALPIPAAISDTEAAPLLCAGAIGYRSLRLTTLKDGQNLGLTGFGASGHLVLMMARKKYPNSRVFVFARNPEERAFAEELGAVWSGDTDESSPEKLAAIIDTTPVWKPVVEALKNLQSGGRLVINAIRKKDIDKQELLKIDYPTHLWLEKEIKSVANVAREDVSECLKLAAQIPLKPEVQLFQLEQANQALLELHHSQIRGAKVLKMD
jgi:propanol-preferring alcohol dehydrogenase